jgi:glycyl-tRNA synthetase beta subunit
LTEPREKELWGIFQEVEGPISEMIVQKRYEEAAQLYCGRFAQPLHAFFEEVFVNVDDPQVRTNRLSLVKRINLLFSRRFADLSEIGRQ